MKKLLIATIAAVLWVGRGQKPLSEADRALLDAAMEGNIEAVRQHLADGADVNAEDDRGGTPLYWAADGGQKEIVDLLIAEGADVNAYGYNHKTPLNRALFGGHEEIADILRKHGGKSGAAVAQVGQTHFQ